MAQPTFWWLLAGAVVAVELLTGTFYLLMIAFGLVTAAIVAHLGAGAEVQILTAAVLGGGAVVAWHLKSDRSRNEPPAQANANVNLDIGETVQVSAWNADGTAEVKYRGANWTVIHRAGASPATGAHRVSEVVGNRLVVDKA